MPETIVNVNGWDLHPDSYDSGPERFQMLCEDIADAPLPRTTASEMVNWALDEERSRINANGEDYVVNMLGIELMNIGYQRFGKSMDKAAYALGIRKKYHLFITKDKFCVAGKPALARAVNMYYHHKKVRMFGTRKSMRSLNGRFSNAYAKRLHATALRLKAAGKPYTRSLALSHDEQYRYDRMTPEQRVAFLAA